MSWNVICKRIGTSYGWKWHLANVQIWGYSLTVTLQQTFSLCLKRNLYICILQGRSDVGEGLWFLLHILLIENERKKENENPLNR